MTLNDWVLFGIAALVVTGAIVVGAIRAMWVYRAPLWLRRGFLALTGVGIVSCLGGYLLNSEWLIIAGVAVIVVPFGGWFVAQSISYTGPPPGLLNGPKALDTADELLDSIAETVIPRRAERSDEDDA